MLPVAFLVALALAAPIASGDLWWHLNTGRLILDEGVLPATDPFSHTAGDRPWILEEYGSQVLLALVHAAGGVAALRIVGALLALALLAVVWRTAARRVPPAFATFLTALFALLYGLKWELRPHLVSAFFLFRAVHVLFGRARGGEAPGRRDWIELFVLTAVWTQLHAEALFVPLLAAAGLIGALLAALLEGGSRARVTGWAAAFACALAGNLVSPFGLAPLKYALIHRAVPEKYIEEWFPLAVLPGDPRFPPLTNGLFFAVAVVFAAGTALVLTQALGRLRARRPDAPGSPAIPWERIGLVALCVVMAFQARRFFFLLWFPALEALALTLRARPALALARALPLAAALALALPLSRSHYAALARDADWSEPVNAALLPVHAARFVADSGLAGNLYHPYEWGGFLGFQLGRACPVFIDGRTVLFEEVIEERWRAERDPAFAEQVFERRDVGLIVFKRLVDHGQGATGWRPPGAHRDWIRVWADELAAVWLRADRRDQVERAVAWWREQGVELDPARGVVEAQVVAARPAWVRERRLLPPVVADALAAAPAGDAPVERLARAELWQAHRMGRSARWELERLLDALEVADPRGGWDAGRRLLERDGVPATLEWLRGRPPL